MTDLSEISQDDIILLGEIIKEKNLETVNKIHKPIKPKCSFYTKHGKRLFDFIIALLALIISCPVNIIIAIVTFFDVGRPILFFQKRSGINNKEFTIVKFRNMRNIKDSTGQLLPPECRVTKWGKFVRKTSLDELLNFWSILKGDMSIIGPRPLHIHYSSWYSNRHFARLSVRPGLECPMLREKNIKGGWQERFENDVLYAENCSLLLDIKLCFKLVSATLNPEKERENGDAGAFIGYDEKGMAMSINKVPDEITREFLRRKGCCSVDEIINGRVSDYKANSKIKGEVLIK